MLTLGDCVVMDTHGRRLVARGTLTEVLGEISSVAPATLKMIGIGGEDRQTSLCFQNLSDPNLVLEKWPSPRSVMHARTGGPQDEVQHGPYTWNSLGHSR